MYAASALIGVLAAAVAIPVFALGAGSSGGGVEVHGNAVAIIDPGSNRVTGQLSVGARPGAIAFGDGGLWVSNLDDQSVSRVDPKTNQSVRAIPMGEPVQGLAAGHGAVWAISVVPNERFAQLRQIDPRFDTIAKSTRVQAGALLAGGGLGNDAAVAVSGATVWAGTDSGLLDRLDPSGRVRSSLDTGNSPDAIAVGANGVWVADPYGDNVARIDPATNLVSTPIPVGNGPSAVAVGAGAVWVSDSLDNAVVRINPNTSAVTNTFDVGRSPTGIAVGEGAVWVANSGDGTVSRIDLRTHAVSTIQVGGSPQAVALGGGRVWVTVQAAVIAPRRHRRAARFASTPLCRSTTSIPLFRTSISRGRSSMRPARSCSTTRTGQLPQGPGSFPRSPRRCPKRRTAGKRTRSPSAKAFGSRHPQTNRSPLRRSSPRSSEHSTHD